MFDTTTVISSTAGRQIVLLVKVRCKVTNTVNTELHTLHAERDPKTHSRCHVHENMHSLWHPTCSRNWNSRWGPHAKLRQTTHGWKSKWCLKTNIKQPIQYTLILPSSSWCWCHTYSVYILINYSDTIFSSNSFT